MENHIQDYFLPSDATIRDAMQKIDNLATGIAFVVDEKQALKAIVTDGDIRRALLRGSTLDDSVEVAANQHPIFASPGTPQTEINRLFQEKKITMLPLVDQAGRIVDFVRQSAYFPVARSIFSGNELKYVTEAILSGWISSAGPYVSRFEKEFAAFNNVEHALVSSNGTTALHLALLALGIGPGDEVIVPSFTFIATANAVLYVGATPVFVDVESTYWQMDTSLLEAAITARTKAIIPVHLYGHPAKMDDIMAIAKAHHLFVVEDAAEAIGAEVNGKKVGSWGDVGIFSFYGNKIITTGEGGMITTNNAAYADKIRVLRDHGMSKNRRYWHEVLGYNYRLTNLQAAVGLAQLERINSILKRKIEIAAWYNRYLEGVKGITRPGQATWAKNVYWMYSILLDEAITGISRDAFILALKEKGIDTRPFFVPIHQQPVYHAYQSLHFPNSEALSVSGVNLPSSVDLREVDVIAIVEKIKEVIS